MSGPRKSTRRARRQTVRSPERYIWELNLTEAEIRALLRVADAGLEEVKYRAEEVEQARAEEGVEQLRLLVAEHCS